MLDAWLDLAHGSACLGCSRPGRMLCAGCEAVLPHRGRPVRPEPCPPGLVTTYAAGEYADTLRALVVTHKEHRGFALAAPLGGVLAGVLGELLGDASGPGCSAASGRSGGSGGSSSVLLVPVPSRAAVVRERGHDPLGRIVRVAAARLRREHGPAQVAGLLEQRSRVADQSGLGAAQRAANLEGTLRVRGRVLAAYARNAGPVRVVLCDDVMTTGSTLREAQRALESVGVGVHAAACIAATRRRLPPPAENLR